MIGDIVIFVFILIVAGAIGKAFIRNIPSPVPSERFFDSALIFPLGLALVSYLVYLIGNIGQLSIIPVFVLLGVLFIVSMFFASPIKGTQISSVKLSLAERTMVILLGAFCLITFIGALAPAIGTDSLCYHLGIPKKFVLEGSIGFIPYTMNSLFPFFLEILFTIGVLFKSAVSAKLIHWVCGPLAVMAIYAFTKGRAGRQSAFLAALLFLASPGIFNEMVYAYVDVALALYVALAVFSLVVWAENKSYYRYLFLSGLFLGVSMSIKYVAIYAALPMTMLLVYELIAGRKNVSFLKGLFVFVAPCVAVSFFWYLRSYIVLGNPVFPAFPDLFDMPIKFEMAHHMKKGMGKGILQLVLLPWNLLVHPGGFGSRSSQLGPQFFILLPFLYYGFRTFRGWFRRLSFILVIYVLIWFSLAQKDRFLYPMLPVLAVMIASSVGALISGEWRGKRVVSIFATSFIAVSVVFGLGVCAYHNRQNYKVAFGLETKDEFLSEWVTNYKMAEYVNKNLPEDSKILGFGIYKPYYFDRWVVREGLFDRWEDYRAKYTTSESMIAYLKDNGFDHIIYKQVNDAPAPEYLQLIIEDKEPVFSYGPIQNAEKPQKERFFLYKL